MSAGKDGWSRDFEALSRQYWNAWSEMARHASSGSSPQTPPGWQEMMDLWSPWAKDGREQTDETISRMNRLTGDWFGKMQELATRLASKPATPADIAAEWKHALGIENNPFVGMFKSMTGPDAHSLEDWMLHAGPWLDSIRSHWGNAFNAPAFGIAREHQERWQALAKSQMDYQQALSAYNAQLMECGQRAFAKFEDLLAERSEPGRQIDSARALFDLWIDAAEEAWGEVAMTPEFRAAYGDLVNAQSRVRAGVQGEVERSTGMLGMPTRTEVNSSHRKVTQLEREVRELKVRLAGMESGGKPASSPKSSVTSPAKKSAKPATRSKK
jgi:hypothetical protein